MHRAGHQRSDQGCQTERVQSVSAGDGLQDRAGTEVQRYFQKSWHQPAHGQDLGIHTGAGGSCVYPAAILLQHQQTAGQDPQGVLHGYRAGSISVPVAKRRDTGKRSDERCISGDVCRDGDRKELLQCRQDAGSVLLSGCGQGRDRPSCGGGGQAVPHGDQEEQPAVAAG